MTKKIGIMQPYFFPYLGYWQLMNAVDEYVIYDDVNYIKNGWINRNNILLNGNKYLITIPLDGASPFTPINQIKITSNTIVKNKLLKTIEQAYKKAPYFNNIFPIIKEVIEEDSCLISKALEKQFTLITQYLNIKTKLTISSNLHKNNDLKAEEKVIHICKLLNGTDYYNTIGGQTLYSQNNFYKENLTLHFLQMNDITYPQFKNQFIPSLSIIDVMMFNSPEQINQMLDKYELITPTQTNNNLLVQAMAGAKQNG